MYAAQVKFIWEHMNDTEISEGNYLWLRIGRPRKLFEAHLK